MYYIIEHPRRGVLVRPEGRNRFSNKKAREDALRFSDLDDAIDTRSELELTPRMDPVDCIIMRSPTAWNQRWVRVLAGPIEEPLNA